MEYLDEAERRLGMTQEPWGLVLHELLQAEERGHDIATLRAAYERTDPGDETALLDLYERIPGRVDEADPAHAIAALPDVPPTAPPADLADRIHGAWLGRVAGNMLGKPVELGWPRAHLTAYLESSRALPLADYIPLDDLAHAADLGFAVDLAPVEHLTRGRITAGVRDDDLDYTVLNLEILERAGGSFTTRDVAAAWLSGLPLYRTYTAERAAYANLVRGVPLADAGAVRNPYREWIGALIRADVFGWVAAGDPRRAALLASRDAVLSHRGDGILGETWAAALIATAFTADSPAESVRASLEHVPGESRLAGEVRAVLGDFDGGLSWEAAMDRLDERYPRMSWVHVLNNAGALTAAILWGGGDFSATIGLAVLAGLDTDSIGATAGSWTGAFVGTRGIPAHWTEPLHDRTTTALFGSGEVRISALANRTLRVIEDLRGDVLANPARASNR